jgi:5-methylcytosine-specific restriction endonuclease McrA
VRVPKPHRVTDKALLKALRIGYCELCGRADMECGVHHIITKASGGADSRCNLVCLCAVCHTAAHAGNITKEQLWAIVAAREGMTAEQVEQEARRLAREAHGAFFGILGGAEGVEA